jgi:cytochrome c oxidase subunit 3
MSYLGLVSLNFSRKKIDRNKVIYTLLLHEDWKVFKTSHSYHLVDPSPWPLIAAFGGFKLTTGLVLFMHKFSGGLGLLNTGLFAVCYVMFVWWRDIVREATFQEQHSSTVQKGIKLGVILFIVSEVMFFFGFFWAFFHSSIAPAFNIGGVWPPKAISIISTFALPFLNTILLLTSGASITWGHHAVSAKTKNHSLSGLIYTVGFATLFTLVQGREYIDSPFNISDGVYGSCFYMTTGFHGFHVFVGSVALLVALIRIVRNDFTRTQFIGLEAGIWYWHFVDVVWLFLFINIYWWGSSIIQNY